MKFKITLFVLFMTIFASAQDPAIQWQSTIGGSASDILNSIEPTIDGGYILAGYSASNISGEKTENSNGGLDMWIVKIDAVGAIEWQNTIGGSGDDFVNVVKPTSDGGYIVLGGSDSNISGDKTENSRGGLDYWIIKLNEVGGIVWQRTYGGANPDFDTYGQETADGGFIVGGYSDSNVSGDKTDPSNGQRDYWVLKLDSAGGIVWQNSIGGALIDRVVATFQEADGGYIIGGFSTSGISGDKTEASQGGSDYWIIKLDSGGNIIWQNTIGGNAADPLRDIIETSDGGYLASGYSLSNISGDKNENSQGDYDYWIVKLDATGNISWQNTVGGAGIDYPRDIKQLVDGTYLVAGYSNSNISGDKTETSNGGYDYWLLKLDASGVIISQNSIGGVNDESGPYAIPTSDGNYILACSSDSNISGDKTENSRGLDDYWIFKVSSSILGMANYDIAAKVTSYPNPTNGYFKVDLGVTFKSINISITDILGKEIYSHNFENTQNIPLRLDAETGIYLINVVADGLQSTFKMVKN